MRVQLVRVPLYEHFLCCDAFFLSDGLPGVENGPERIRRADLPGLLLLPSGNRHRA